jgi:YHS domain-containing protein
VIPAPTPAIGVQPAPAPTVQTPDLATPTPDATATQEENPFSGLRLSVPEPAAQKPALSTESAAPQAQIPTQPNSELPNTGSPSATKTLRTLPATMPASAPQSGFPANAAHPTQSKSGAHSAPAPSTNPFLETPVERTITLSLLDDNLRKLAASPEKLGYKGFCPVELRQHRTLAAVKPQFSSTYLNKKFRFSSAEAKAQFEKSPELYAPAHDGMDGVALLDQDKSVEASLDFAAWYQGRLYMFTTRENLELFNADPDQYMDAKDLDSVLEKATTNPAKLKQTPATSTPPARQTLRTKTGRTTTPRTQGNPNSAKSPATRSASQPGPATGARSSQTNAVKKQATVDLPVLGDNLDAIEPIVPHTNTGPGANPATVQPNRGSPAPNVIAPNPNFNTPANTTAPRTAVPRKLNSPAPKTDGANSDRPQLEGPKMQGPKLNYLAAPIKPASASETQQKYAPPKLIDPPLQLATPMLTPPSN